MLLKHILAFCFMTICTYKTYTHQEIEFKIAIPTEQKITFLQWLKNNNATHKGTFEHEEEYFTPGNADWTSDKTLRIRTATNIKTNEKKYSTCYKHTQPDYREEHETTINSVNVLKAIYVDYFKAKSQPVHKTRNTYILNGLEIAFDEIEELKDLPCGNLFVEIEVKKTVTSPEEGIHAIEELLKDAGVTTFVKYHRNYIHMITDPEARIGTKIFLNESSSH